MSKRIQDTVVVFPRISNKHGPARTLYKKHFIAPNPDPSNPFFNPLSKGYTESTDPNKSNKTEIILDPVNNIAQESRNAQRFMKTFKRPDDETRKLISRRRPT